jgi:hypothetical protein
MFEEFDKQRVRGHDVELRNFDTGEGGGSTSSGAIWDSYAETATVALQDMGERKRKAVVYDDGLTETQFMNMVESEEQKLENARVSSRSTRLIVALFIPPFLHSFILSHVSRYNLNASHVHAFQNAQLELNKSKRKAKAGTAPPSTPLDPALSRGTIKILNELCKTLDETGEYLVYGLFIEKPDKKLFPDYYQVISNPIAIRSMVAFLKKGKHSSVEGVKEDMELLCRNASKYNQEGSVVHNVSLALKDEFFNKLDELQRQLQAAAVAGGGSGGEHEGEPELKKKRTGRPVKGATARLHPPAGLPPPISSSSSSDSLSLKMTLPSALFKTSQQRQLPTSQSLSSGDSASADPLSSSASSSSSSSNPSKKVKIVM